MKALMNVTIHDTIIDRKHTVGTTLTSLRYLSCQQNAVVRLGVQPHEGKAHERPTNGVMHAAGGLPHAAHRPTYAQVTRRAQT
jgi:hypothetical protein